MTTTVPAKQAIRVDFDRLAEHYAFRDPEAVVAFIRAHPEVVAPLLDAVAVIPRFFGPGREVALELERDRDAPDHVQLFALIRIGEDAEDGLARLDRFDEDWWLDVLPQVGPRLVFTIEYA